MSTTTLHAAPVPRLIAARVTTSAGDRHLVRDVSLAIGHGELVAVIGGSGAGKSTLLETLAGLREQTAGHVVVDGVDVASPAGRRGVGFVPQDDIIHLDLPLARTLRYAARLRLPDGSSREEVGAVVARVLADLDLAHVAETRVRDLSGGQRKRASVAVELLTAPRVLFLDEPTSGLDPATAAEVLAVLRRLSDQGTSVVLTTHAPTDVERCDRVVVLAPGGVLVHDGPPAGAPAAFGVTRLDEVYAATTGTAVPPVAPAEAVDEPCAPSVPVPVEVPPRDDGRDAVAGRGRQLVTLTARSAELMRRNRLTASILVGSPALVVAMLVLLFPAATVGPSGDPVGAVQLVYWIAFAGFFFGLTYGLLQVVVEAPIVRRERAGGLSLSAYVASKALVLLPLLVLVDGVLVAVLQLTGRLPSLPAGTVAILAGVVLLDAAAGLALGVLTSALVGNAAQATLALPMLCFPQVLFAGAMVPVDVMATGGRAVSQGMSNRWAFEAIGRVLELPARFPGDPSPLGSWHSAFEGGALVPAVSLAVMAMLCLTGAVVALRRRTGTR